MMDSSIGSLTLVRLAAELTLKSRRTRAQFMRRLVANIADALDTHGIEHAIDVAWGRMFVRATDPAAPVLLSRIFGISSVSPIARVSSARLADIVATGEDLFAADVRDRHFAVRARRVGTHDFSSKDIEIELGTALVPHAAGVRLNDPDVTVHVEVRDDRAYLFTGRIAGVGGLPLGVEGNAVALLSGGFDSAVAAWLIMKRGVALDYVFCNLGGDAYERAVLHVAKVLSDEWSWGTSPKLHVVDFAEPLRALRECVKQSYWQVVLKRLMYRAASRIGEAAGAAAIVTGESIGQVSSQTLSNLQAIEPAATLPVFRPLLGFDKEEIIARARAVGTAALSEQVREYCAIAPGKPVTASSPARVTRAESELDPAVLERAVAAHRTLDLRSLAPADLVAPYLFTTTISDDAIVFDIRSPEQFRALHVPGAVLRDEWELLRAIPSLDRDRTYVLCCAHGIQTAWLAEKMQRAGIEAHSFRGGVRAAVRWFERNSSERERES
ncbi:MAG: tRNA 4-thiouridine(8) synthase ThiI [Gemmatimonadetes bacterium]|nr:tRNA 4-thiouridine(8) synthase ThiI [Gemmatimonadota bacterium]